MIDEVVGILNECGILENINVLNDKQFKTFSYELIVEANLLFNSSKVKIKICIPKTWYKKLIDIYIVNYGILPFMPHISCDGKVCLFDIEGCLIDKNLAGIIVQSLFQAQNILEQGVAEKNKGDFIEEFELYFGELKNVRQAKFVVPPINEDIIVKYKQRTINKLRKEKYFKYVKRKNEATFYVAQTTKELERWRLERECIKNAVYFVIYPQDTIYSPDIRNSLSLKYLNMLLGYVSNKAMGLLEKLPNEKLVLFAIKQPNGECNYIGFYLTGAVIERIENKYYFKNCKIIQPIEIRRADKEYMLLRSKDKEINQYKKKILVIGCGSIGGHLINELSKAGYEELTIVDDDILTEENIYRHVLGMEYVSFAKCEAMATYINKNIPNMVIKTLKEKANDAILEGNLELDEFDVVISAVGSHNFNRWLNEYVISKEVATPIIYAWNEVCGIGNHVAYFKFGNRSCYECLFERDEYSGEIYDKTSYCKRGQKVVYNSGGCGKSYVPYGNTISIKTVLICLDVLKDIFNNNLDDNMLVSLKGDRSFFVSKGLELSSRYLMQKTQTVKLLGKEFGNCKCGVCNGSRN